LAQPITLVFDGVVDSGKADFTGSLVDISGRAYEVRVTTALTDSNPDPTRGVYTGVASDFSTRVTIAGLGTTDYFPPDLIRKSDDGSIAHIDMAWAGGLEGVLSVFGPPGAFGDPNILGPFSALDTSSRTDSRVAIGAYEPHDMAPHYHVWFDDVNPVSVRVFTVRTPDGGSTFALAASALLCCAGAPRVLARRKI